MGPIAERSKSSDLVCGRGDPGSNPGEGRLFSAFFQDGELSVTRIDGYRIPSSLSNGARPEVSRICMECYLAQE